MMESMLGPLSKPSKAILMNFNEFLSRAIIKEKQTEMGNQEV